MLLGRTAAAAIPDAGTISGGQKVEALARVTFKTTAVGCCGGLDMLGV